MRILKHATFAAFLMMATRAVTAEIGDPLQSQPPPARLAVWGDVCPPSRISGPDPEFPNVGGRVQGVVILEVWIRKDGTVADVKVLKPLPLGISEAAVAAVREWRYSPGTVAGVAVPVVHNQTVHFRLQHAPH